MTQSEIIDAGRRAESYIDKSSEPSITKRMETHPEEYDVVVLGSGEAGKYLAWTLAKKGMRAVVIERKYIGGSCPNIACMPSKNVIHSAKVASYFWRSGEFGITRDNTQISMPGVRDRKRKMVDGMVEVHLARLGAASPSLNETRDWLTVKIRMLATCYTTCAARKELKLSRALELRGSKENPASG